MSKRIDGAEAIANAAAGLVVSALSVQLLWPVFGWQVTASQSGAVAVIFFCLSTVRAYVLRRIFRVLQ
jgi:hypothetical protein